MLIRSTLISIFLAATLTSAANCDSSPEKPVTAETAPVPVISPTPTPLPEPTPEPTPTPDPTPVPEPEVPKRVNLMLLPEQSACGVEYKVKVEASGAIHIGFDGLISEAPQGKYSARCRLAAEVVIPKGYRLNPSVTLTAVVKGELKGWIDNVTGRLKFSLGRATARDFQLVEYKEDDAALKSVQLDLKVQLPELLHSCSQDLVWPVSLFVESSVNGKASSRIEELKLDSLSLLPLDCEP